MLTCFMFLDEFEPSSSRSVVERATGAVCGNFLCLGEAEPLSGRSVVEWMELGLRTA